MGKAPKMHELFKSMVSERNMIDGCGVWHLIYDNIKRLFEHGVMLDDPEDDSSRFIPEHEHLLGIKSWNITATPGHGLILSVSVVFEDGGGEIYGFEDDPCTYVCPVRFLYLSDEELVKIARKYEYADEDHDDALAEEARERAEYERLKAKFESPQSERHTCANCDFMKKKHENKWYECWCGGEMHALSWIGCKNWEPKGTKSSLLKHLKGEL